MEIKEQIKQELLKQKEEKVKQAIEENSKLKEINLYITPEHPTAKLYKKHFTEQGIKFKESNLLENIYIKNLVQINTQIVIEVNGEYLALGRDFNSPIQCINILRHVAQPDYKLPPFEIRIVEAFKNLSFNMGKSIQGLNRSLQPITRIMTELAQEDAKEKKLNESKKNK